jgi:hypothetical protein
MSGTETVYRHQLKPVITKGAETMNTIFTDHADKKTASLRAPWSRARTRHQNYA